MSITFYLSLIFFTIITVLNLRLAWWLLLMLLPAYLLRTQIWLIPTTWLELAIYVLFAVNIFKLWHQKILFTEVKKLWTNYRVALVAVGLWLVAALVATIISPDLRLSAGVLKGWWFDPILLLLTSLLLIKNKKDINYLILGLLSGGALVGTWGLIEYVFNFGMQADNLLNSVYKPANYVALLVVPIILLGWGALKNSTNLNNRLLISFLISLQLVALWYTKSYGGFLGLMSGILILLFFITSKKVKKIAAIFFLLLIFVGILTLASQPKFQKIINLTERNSLTTRLQIWEISLEVAKQHSFFGVGLGNFYTPYRTQAFAMYQPPLEWEVVKAHNLFLNLWLEVGILGLLVFVYLIIIFARCTYQLLKQNLTPTEWWYIAPSVAAMIATLTHGLLDTPYFKNDLAILFLLIWILPFILWQQKVNNID